MWPASASPSTPNEVCRDRGIEVAFGRVGEKQNMAGK